MPHPGLGICSSSLVSLAFAVPAAGDGTYRTSDSTAEEAVNLDGGGSTTMTIGEDLVNRTSDPTGERPIGDAIVLMSE